MSARYLIVEKITWKYSAMKQSYTMVADAGSQVPCL